METVTLRRVYITIEFSDDSQTFHIIIIFSSNLKVILHNPIHPTNSIWFVSVTNKLLLQRSRLPVPSQLVE